MAYLALLFVSALWGTSFLLIQIVGRSIDPLGLAAGRVLIAALALAAVSAFQGGRWPRGVRTWSKVAALAVIGQVLPFVLLAAGAKLTTSVDQALIMGAIPIVIFVAGRFVPPAEPWNAVTAAGLVLGVLGVAAALAAPVEVGGTSVWIGRGAALLAALGYGFATLVSRNLSRDLDTWTSAASSMAVSAVLLVPAWLLFHPAYGATPVAGQAIAGLVFLGLVNTGIVYVVYFRLIETAGATFAGMNNYIVPLVGLAGGALVLGEPVHLSALAGLGAILAGVVLVRRGHAPRPPPS